MVAERDDDGCTGKVLWHVTMSLDGFIAGPDDAMDCAFQAGKPGPMGGEIRLERTNLANPRQITDLRFRVVR
jgi:hypothetical protein